MWTVTFQMFKLDSEKAEEPEIKLSASTGSSKKQESPRKKIYFCFIDYAKAFDCVDHNKLWKILKEMTIPDLLTCLLRNLHAGQEATVRTGYGTTDWFQIGKGVCQGCVLAWRIPGTGEHSGLPSTGSHRAGHDWSDLVAAAAARLCVVTLLI